MSNQTGKTMVNKTTMGDKLKTYLKHPGSFIVMLLVMLAAVITFAVLIFLIAYILINGVPHITPSLFSLEYSSENASVVPAFVNTIVMTLLSLLIAVPFGIFSAIFLVEYAKRGNKFVEPLWYAVLCKYAGMGILHSGRRIYDRHHDPSADHEDDRGSAESSSGFLP